MLRILMLIGPVLFFACSKKTDDPLPAGGEVTGGEKISTGAIFPHTARFYLFDHGKLYRASAKKCQVCHGEDLRGGNSNSSCQSCHTSFPHDGSILDGKKHGPLYVAQEESCVQCHKAGEKTTESCLKCHQFPHTQQFKLSSQHGKNYRENNESCTLCHGQDLAGGKVQKACKSCHQNFPHDPTFLYTNQHGIAFLENQQACSKCHRPTPKMVEEQTSCYKCHHYPHQIADTDKWPLGLGHGQAFLHENNHSIKCDHCHDKNSGFAERHPEKMVKCDTCHMMMPHSRRYRRMHKTRLEDKDPINCKMCHINYKERLNPADRSINCTTCHDGEDLRMEWIEREE